MLDITKIQEQKGNDVLFCDYANMINYANVINAVENTNNNRTYKNVKINVNDLKFIVDTDKWFNKFLNDKYINYYYLAEKVMGLYTKDENGDRRPQTPENSALIRAYVMSSTDYLKFTVLCQQIRNAVKILLISADYDILSEDDIFIQDANGDIHFAHDEAWVIEKFTDRATTKEQKELKKFRDYVVEFVKKHKLRYMDVENIYFNPSYIKDFE